MDLALIYSFVPFYCSRVSIPLLEVACVSKSISLVFARSFPLQSDGFVSLRYCICLFLDIAVLFESKNNILLDIFLDYNKKEALCSTGKWNEMEHY